MITQSTLEEVDALTKEVEQLEEEQRIKNFKIMTLITPYLGSAEACEVLLDHVPLGYVSFKVRQALDNASCTNRFTTLEELLNGSGTR